MTTRSSGTLVVGLATGLLVYVASTFALGMLFQLVVGRFGIGTAEDDVSFVILYLVVRTIPPIAAILGAVLVARRSSGRPQLT